MPRRLITPDKALRTPTTILCFRELRTKHLKTIGYHEIEPWAKWVGINPLFNKPFRGKSRLWL